MKLYYFSEEAYNYLYDHMEANKDKYESNDSWVKEFFDGKSYLIESAIEYPDFCLVNSGDKTRDDIENTKILYSALGNILTPKQACNKYIWSYLAHEKFWKYVRMRWPVENGASIKTRYFCGDSRISLSLNALSRLWWYGFLTYDKSYPMNPYHYTELMTSNTDLCQNLVQHKYSMNKDVILGILDGIQRFLNENGVFTMELERNMIKYINRYGAVTCLDILEKKEISDLVYVYLWDNQ